MTPERNPYGIQIDEREQEKRLHESTLATLALAWEVKKLREVIALKGSS